MNKVFGGFILFLLFAACNAGHVTYKNTSYIGIQPFDNIDNQSLNSIKNELENIYKKKVVILKTIDLPKSAFTNIKSPRYRADSLIRFLRETKNDSIDIVIGITTKDISTTKKDDLGLIKKPKSKYQDWGVFGLGFCPGKSCVVSTFRIKGKSQKVFLTRLTKISVHEVGHNFGLPHCPNKNCVMTDACESIKTVDNVQLSLCEACIQKIN